VMVITSDRTNTLYIATVVNGTTAQG
jgi:hypothetical protein